jgi:hypothetical protein
VEVTPKPVASALSMAAESGKIGSGCGARGGRDSEPAYLRACDATIHRGIMSHPLLDDPFVAAEIERALAPLAAGLSPEELAWSRERLAEMLAEDAELRGLLSAAHPRTVEQSGERLRLGLVAPATEQAEAALPRKPGGR